MIKQSNYIRLLKAVNPDLYATMKIVLCSESAPTHLKNYYRIVYNRGVRLYG